MSPCLSLKDLVELNQEQVQRTEATAQSLDPRAPESCEIFAEQVRPLESSLIYTYRAAVYLARRTEDVEVLRDIWRAVSTACDQVLRALKTLKDDYPRCGAPALYDLALDYKNAANKRYELNREAIEWKNAKMPDGLFPETS